MGVISNISIIGISIIHSHCMVETTILQVYSRKTWSSVWKISIDILTMFCHESNYYHKSRSLSPLLSSISLWLYVYVCVSMDGMAWTGKVVLALAWRTVRPNIMLYFALVWLGWCEHNKRCLYKSYYCSTTTTIVWPYECSSSNGKL